MHIHSLSLLCALLMVAGCESRGSAPESATGTLAGMSVEEGEGGLWWLIVTDADGLDMRIRIRWSDYDDMYRTDGYDGGLSGPLFGNPNPKFASAADLRAMGRTPAETVHSFDPRQPPDASWKDFEDVSVIHTYTGDLVIGRWEGEHVTDIWYVGPFADLLRERIAQGDSRCDALASLCCREEVVTLADEDQDLPRPVIQACYGAAMACEDQAQRDATCACMFRACFEVDMDLPRELSSPAAQCCSISFLLCDAGRARPTIEALNRYGETFKQSPPALISIAAVIDRLTANDPSSSE